ncbi:MAG TPA: hypothetical protein VGN17_26995 [Bryobacteraceae bacterium]|jgi:Flp pilus assembly CpaE family ATPase
MMPDTHASVVVISPNRAAQQAVAAALQNRVKTLVSFATYPHPHKLIELPQPAGGCLMYLDFADPFLAKVIAEEVDSSFPNISVVALHNETSPQDLLDLMRLGVREVISAPPMEHEVLAAYSHFASAAAEQAEGGGPGRIVAFLPAKPGAGATTLAVHAAAAAARVSEKKALLVDFDFRNGVTSFLLKLPGLHSVLDALELNRDLDREHWNTMVARVGPLDVLGSAPLTLRRSDPEDGTGLLLEFARHLYPCVCVDLPGDMRAYELDVLRRAQECLLVCTPDMVSLHMAKAKADMLRQLKVDGKTSVILNRSGSGAFVPIREIQELLQLPVRFSVPHAEKEMKAAVEAASVLTGRSALVTQIESIARYIVRDGSGAPPPQKARRFLDLFTTAPSGAR